MSKNKIHGHRQSSVGGPDSHPSPPAFSSLNHADRFRQAGALGPFQPYYADLYSDSIKPGSPPPPLSPFMPDPYRFRQAGVFFQKLYHTVRQLRMVDAKRLALCNGNRTRNKNDLCSSFSGNANPLMMLPSISSNSAIPL